MGIFEERQRQRTVGRPDNPFAPRPGAVPPLFAGRDQHVDRLLDLLSAVRGDRSGGVVFLTGPRGQGKTALLVESAGAAARWDVTAVRLELQQDRSASADALLTQVAELVGRSGAGELVRRVTGLTVGPVGVELADPAQRDQSVTGLLLELARQLDGGLVVLLDETQQDPALAASVVRAAHRATQDQLPLGAVLAGLPSTVRDVVKEVSYAERFDNIELRSLTSQQAHQAIAGPLADAGVELPADRARHVDTVTGGYPFFVQLLGAALWDQATDGRVTSDQWNTAATATANRIDSWLAQRFARLTASEQAYLRAGQATGGWPASTGAIVEQLDSDHATQSPVRARLIGDGLLWAPGYGQVDLVIPPLGPWMERTSATG